MRYLFVTICLCVIRRTAAIIMASSGQSNVEVIRSWRLNERHYGMLQGHKKNCPKLARAFGEDLLMEWRKSYHTPPPSIDDEEAMQKLGRESRTMSTSLMDPRYVETSPYENHRNRFSLLIHCLSRPFCSHRPSSLFYQSN
jgi:bisphosphoglycerate-dependent phosphoglycerate mutase